MPMRILLSFILGLPIIFAARQCVASSVEWETVHPGFRVTGLTTSEGKFWVCGSGAQYPLLTMEGIGKFDIHMKTPAHYYLGSASQTPSLAMSTESGVRFSRLRTAGQHGQIVL